MFNEEREVTERLATVLTLVRLLASVYHPVLHEVGDLAEGFATFLANVRFLSSVSSLMQHEGKAPTESFPTLLAPIRPVGGADATLTQGVLPGDRHGPDTYLISP